MAGGAKLPGDWLSRMEPDDALRDVRKQFQRNRDERKNRAAEAEKRRARFGLVPAREPGFLDRMFQRANQRSPGWVGRGLSTLGRSGALYAPAAIGASLFSDDVAAASVGSPYDRATGPEMFDLPHTTTPTYGLGAYRSFPGAAPAATASYRGMLAAHPAASSEYTTEWYRPGSEKFKREAGVAAMREDPSGIAVLPSPLDSDYTRLLREFMRGEPSVIEPSMPMMREDVSPYIDADRMLGPVSLETPTERAWSSADVSDPLYTGDMHIKRSLLPFADTDIGGFDFSKAPAGYAPIGGRAAFVSPMAGMGTAFDPRFGTPAHGSSRGVYSYYASPRKSDPSIYDETADIKALGHEIYAIGSPFTPGSSEYIEPGSTTSVEKVFHGPTTPFGGRHDYYDKLELEGLSDPFADRLAAEDKKYWGTVESESEEYEAERLAEELAWSAARDERLDVPDVRTYIPDTGLAPDSLDDPKASSWFPSLELDMLDDPKASIFYDEFMDTRHGPVYTPPIPEPTGPPSWLPKDGIMGKDSLDAIPVSPYLGGVGSDEALYGAEDYISPSRIPSSAPSWFPGLPLDMLDDPKASIFYDEFMDTRPGPVYTPPATAPTPPSWFPSLTPDLLDSPSPYGYTPTPTTPVPPSWFPLLTPDLLDSASPPGYDPRTGTFAPPLIPSAPPRIPSWSPLLDVDLLDIGGFRPFTPMPEDL
jgi:hypothetical protein